MKKLDNNAPKPPIGLSPEATAWWRLLRDEYSIADAGGLAALAAGAEAHDRVLQAAVLIAAEGLVSTDRFGQLRAHPAVAIERDARDQMLRALKLLNLDIEPLRGRVGRPAGS
jgi:phage terminase small subunit